MEGIADDIATTPSLDQAALLLAKRPVFGKTRVCVVRRLSSSIRRAGVATGGNHTGESSKESEQGGEAGIVVVVALIQSGTVRQGQALEALLPGSRLLAHHHVSRKTSCARFAQDLARDQQAKHDGKISRDEHRALRQVHVRTHRV
jgi:hypothetical protein